MAVNDRDAAWGRYGLERERVAKVMAGRDSAATLVRGLPGWDLPTLTSIQAGAYFLPMVSRTAETFSGLVFLKAPARTFPEGLEEYTDDVTQTGQEIDRFAEAGFDAVMQTGGLAVLVDFPQAPAGLSKADALKRGFRPVLRIYDANAILGVRVTRIDGALRVTQVRLMEEYDEPGADEFTSVTGAQVRVLDLDETDSYRQRVFRATNGIWTAIETVTPLMGGKALTSIPIFFSNTRDNEPRCEKPPLADLADINIAHLNNSAQTEWALAWLGAPMLFAAGIKLKPGETIQMGSSAAIMAPDATAKLEIVQADGEAVGALKQAMDDKRRDAAALGARMLMETPRAAIAAETARIERAGETSVVGAAANAVSQCMTNALRLLAQWAGLPLEVGVGEAKKPILYWLSTDLMPTRMSPQELAALLEAWSRGALSKRELFARFQEAEVVDGAKSFEDHEEEIEQEGSVASADGAEDEIPPTPEPAVA